MEKDWSHAEVLKLIFPLLDGSDLASCMQVCRQWRDIAKDDYFWKCLCTEKWPSMCKRPSPFPLTYHKMFLTFSKPHQKQNLLPPRLSFKDLEFYIDIWSNGRLIFSRVVPGLVLRTGIKCPPSGVCSELREHLENPNYNLAIPVDPRFEISLAEPVTVSVFIGREDTNKIACIVDRKSVDYVDGTAFRALAYDYLSFAPEHPFISGVRAWISLLFMGNGIDGIIDVFGIELDFSDVAISEEEILWLLDMLDWK